MIYKIILLLFSILYGIYLFSYANWEKKTNQNKFGSFFIKLCVLINLVIVIISFVEKIYYIS